MSGTILVVDDHPMVRNVVQCLLVARGYRVVSAPDGHAALDLFERESIDAALVDVDMPEMTGPEVCRELARRAQAAGRSLIQWLMTGVVRSELIADAQAAGVLGVLEKPFTKHELFACFEENGILPSEREVEALST